MVVKRCRVKGVGCRENLRLPRSLHSLAMTLCLALLLPSPFTFHPSPAYAAEPLLIDDFEGGRVNKLGGVSNTYVKAPSRALALRTDRTAHAGSKALMIKYDKKGQGGPYGTGGWCGYYTLLKAGPRYLDASSYRMIRFWVKGETGSEDFVIGVADRHWDQVGDSVKSASISTYLPDGKLTAEWQLASIPLTEFLLDHKELASVAVCFEGSIFPAGAGKGTVYIDDLQFE